MGDDVKSKAILRELLIVWLDIGETRDAGKKCISSFCSTLCPQPLPIILGLRASIILFLQDKIPN